MKFRIFLLTYLQLFSISTFANPVNFVDNRWYEIQENVREIAADDEINVSKIYDKNDYPKLYDRAEANLDNVYNQAKKNLAPYYANFPEKPLFILTNTDALLPIKVEDNLRSSNIIYISKNTAESEGLEGTIAHELAHYILDHGKNNQAHPKETVKHINTSSDHSSVICSAVNGYSVEIEPDLQNLVDYMLSVSALVEEDTQSVPFDIALDGSVLERLMTRSLVGKMNEKKSCKEAANLRDDISVSTYVKYCSFHGLQECRIPKDVQEDLAQMITKFKSKAISCLEGEHKYFHSVIKEVFGEEGYQTLWSAFENNDYSEFPDPARSKVQTEILFKFENPMKGLMSMYEFRKEYLFKRFEELKLGRDDLRFFTSEDEADMLSQVILMDESNTENKFALSRLQYMSESEKKYCQGIVEKGNMPSYGFLSDIHHSQCWRYWRSVKLKEELKDPSKKDLLVRTLLNNNLKESYAEVYLY